MTGELLSHYLIDDYTGVASGFEYGKAGDKVEYISELHGMILVKNGTRLFHVKPERLTTEKPTITVKEEKLLSVPLKKTQINRNRVKQKSLF